MKLLVVLYEYENWDVCSFRYFYNAVSTSEFYFIIFVQRIIMDDTILILNLHSDAVLSTTLSHGVERNEWWVGKEAIMTHFKALAQG
jgi:hypothetical protein